MHNMKSIMVQLKCPDCGQVFDTGKLACPTCGCPADACTMFDPDAPDQKKTDGTERTICAIRTTDTGYESERTLLTYSYVIAFIIVVGGVIGLLTLIDILGSMMGRKGWAICGIVFVVYTFLVSVWVGFIRIFANISINLHELNMKTQYMALIKCKKCGHSVSNKAKKCPHCGCNLKMRWDSVTFLSFLLLFIFIICTMSLLM